MGYFHDIIFIVYNYFISHNIILPIILHNVTGKQNRQNGMGNNFMTCVEINKNEL